MSKREIYVTRYGEMMDMLACFSINEGAAEPKAPKRKIDFDTFLGLR